MKITDIRPTTVTVPLEAPLRHANGCHWGRFVRTIIEVETDEGLIGLGEMGGGGESAEAAFRAMKTYLVGRDPTRLEELRFLIANPTASLYNNRTQILAALEFACLDILGQKWGVSVSEILGGRLRDRVPFASYLFFRYPHPENGTGEVRTVEQLVAHANELKQLYGFSSHKLKGGVFPPEYELECHSALSSALGGDRFRFDPNGVKTKAIATERGRQRAITFKLVLRRKHSAFQLVRRESVELFQFVRVCNELFNRSDFARAIFRMWITEKKI